MIAEWSTNPTCVSGSVDQTAIFLHARQAQQVAGRAIIVRAPVHLVLVMPNLALWAVPGSALLSLLTLIGWFYTLVVGTILTGPLSEIRPSSRPRAASATT